MNKKQKIVLRVGIVIVVLMGVFPPVNDDVYVENNFLFTEGAVLLSNLFLQWFMVSIIAGGLIYFLRDKKPKDEQKEIKV